MSEKSRRFFLVVTVLLCLALTLVLVTFSTMTHLLRLLFVPYQFFLIGICVGALAAATFVLVSERDNWPSYRTYLAIVMVSVFLIIVVNSVIFTVLEGDLFLRKLVNVFLFVFVPD